MAEVEDLFVVKGNFTIQKEQINANLRVGVKPSVIESSPGAREGVFTQSEDGYLWTHVKVTGPLKHPDEDLSPRLVAAAKEQIFRGIFRIPTIPAMLVLGILGHLFDEQ